MMRDQLKVQELMDHHLDFLAEESHELSFSKPGGWAWINQLSSQIQELIKASGTREQVIERDLEELKKRCDCQRGEINYLKREGELVKEIIGVNHDLKIFSDGLDEAKGGRCRCGEIPSHV